MPAIAVQPSLNRRAAALVETLIRDADLLRLAISRMRCGATLIDAGSACRGSLEAGLQIASIALGGLGEVALTPPADGIEAWQVAVRSSWPALACLGSQRAGWHLKYPDGEPTYEALGSGPARASAARERLFETLGYRDEAEVATIVVEAEKPPPDPLVTSIAQACHVEPGRLTVLLVPTTSLAGSVQVAARALEVALSKAHRAGFPLGCIIEGLARAPLAPPHPDAGIAMGRANDAIIYGGRVDLFVAGAALAARRLAEHLPSSTSAAYGAFFGDVLARAGGDFYAVDPLFFAPAAVRVFALDHGQSYATGMVEPALVVRSFA